MTGFLEAVTFSLCSWNDVTVNLRKEEEKNAVELMNPKTVDFQVGRTSLLPGLLKTVAHNKRHKVPFKFFEIGDVMFLDSVGNDREVLGSMN